MEPVLLGIALGAGALYVARQGRGAMHAAVGWTARKSGWLASRVRSTIDETRAVARAQYERGRNEAIAKPLPTSAVPIALSNGDATRPAPAPSSALADDRATAA